jgi:hypothetical protein
MSTKEIKELEKISLDLSTINDIGIVKTLYEVGNRLSEKLQKKIDNYRDQIENPKTSQEKKHTDNLETSIRQFNEKIKKLDHLLGINEHTKDIIELYTEVVSLQNRCMEIINEEAEKLKVVVVNEKENDDDKKESDDE